MSWKIYSSKIETKQTSSLNKEVKMRELKKCSAGFNDTGAITFSKAIYGKIKNA